MRRDLGQRRGLAAPAFCAIAISAAVTVAHWPVLETRALSHDDIQYLIDNPLVCDPSWRSARRFFSEVIAPSTVEGYYQPLAMVSLMLDCAAGAGPDNLVPIRRTSLLLHVANSLLVFQLLATLLRHVPAAAIGALLFGLHPITVESIAWLAERKGVLSTFFALASVNLYVRYARTGRLWPLGASVFAYALALLSKPTSITLPVLLVLLDWWPLGRLAPRAGPAPPLRRIVLEKAPFGLVGAASALVTYLGQANIAAARVDEGTLAAAPLIVAYDVVLYLRKLLWPVNMSGFYNMPEPMSLANTVVAASAAAALVLAVATAVSLCWTRCVAVGLAYLVVGTLPTMGFVTFTTVAAADKYVYWPMIALLLPIGSALRRAWGDPGRFDDVRVRGRRLACAVPAAAACVALGASTRSTISLWKDTETLFAYHIRTSERPWQPHDGMAVHLLRLGRAAEAEPHARESVRLKGDNYRSRGNLAHALQRLGRQKEALEQYETALQLAPRNPLVQYSAGNLLLELGRRDEAVERYREAVRLRPAFAAAHFNLAAALAAAGRAELAEAHYRAALSADPDHVGARVNLSLLLLAARRPDEAASLLREGVSRRPEQADLRFCLGRALAESGATAEAIEQLERALAIEPDHAGARRALDHLRARRPP